MLRIRGAGVGSVVVLAVAGIVSFVLVQGASEANAAAPLIVSPHGEALVRQPTVRVVITRRAGAKTRVLLGRRNVTARFHVKGNQLIGRLGRRDGLRPGRNHIAVVATRPGKPDEHGVRSIFVLRRSNVFVNVRLLGANPARLRIDIVSAGSRLAIARRERTVRVWLNGRSVTRALIATNSVRQTVALSGSHGLRYGVNRLRVSVVERRTGRYKSVTRRFTVRRDRPLAAAGLDRQIQPGAHVPLGGTAKAARGGRLSYSWRLVKRPPGSRAKISARTRARPSFVPDVPGRYVARVRVSERPRGRASGAQVAGSDDEVMVDTLPSTRLFRVAASDGGIQIGEPGHGGAFFPRPEGRGAVQLLMVDRHNPTQPVGLGNALEYTLRYSGQWLDENGEDDQLVILRIPPAALSRYVPDFPDDVTDINAFLDRIGVPRLSNADLTDKNHQLVIVGVPSGGKRSGWITRHAPTSQLPSLGWLMPDADTTKGFLFQPQQLSFDTRAQSTATTNTMDIAGQMVTSPAPTPQYRFSVHYVEVDPGDLHVVENRTFGLNGLGVSALTGMISEARTHGNYVALQSIGTGWNPCDTGGCKEELLRDALIAMGANPHYFNTIGGAYAFFGGAQLTPSGVVQSNGRIVADAHTTNGPVYQPGTLKGDLRDRPDGYFAPSVEPALPGSIPSLYDAIFDTVGQPWPYTEVPDKADYAKALADISGKLGDEHVNANWADFSPEYATDIRGAYLGLPNYAKWDDAAQVLLDKIHYPNAAADACQGSPDDTSKAPGYSLGQFCRLKAALLEEFSALDSTKRFTDLAAAAFDKAGNKEKGELHIIGQTIHNHVNEDSVEVAGPILGFTRSLAELGEIFEVALAPELIVAASFASDIMELGTSIASAGGKPVGELIADKTDDLAADVSASVAEAGDGLDAIRNVAMSDPARLQAFAKLSRQAQIAPNSPALMSNQLALAGGRYFASTLIRALLKTPTDSAQDDWTAFRYFYQGKNPTTPGECHNKYGSAPEGAWVPFMFDRDSWSGLLFVNDGFRPTYPPPEILDQLFLSPHRESDLLGEGYGVEKTQWFFESLKPKGQQGTAFDDC